MQRTIVVVDYQPEWAHTFRYLAAVIAPCLGDLLVAIEHVGSTSVPGLAAKPVIDIDAVIRSRDQLPAVIERLATLGYTHRGDLDVAGREAFGCPTPDVPRNGSGREWPKHHFYVCAQENVHLRRHLAFRDYLRAYPESADAYGALKKELAVRFPHDIESYIDGKTEFVENILRRAGQSD